VKKRYQKSSSELKGIWLMELDKSERDKTPNSKTMTRNTLLKPSAVSQKKRS